MINTKDKRPDEQKSGIYEIECGGCDKKYCGQTKRRVAARWKEHKAALDLKRIRISAIADHCMASGHSMGDKNLIKEVSNPTLLNAWESFYIRNGRNLVNIDEAPIKSKLLDDISDDSWK